MPSAGAFAIGADHPSLPGHFPGHPLVPGVVVLDRAIALIRQHIPTARWLSFPQVKFLAPVRPGDVVEVAYDRTATDRLSFVCSVRGAPVARGSARIAVP